MDEVIRYVLSHSLDCVGYATRVETEGLKEENVRELNIGAPWFNYQHAILSNHVVLNVNQRYSDGTMLGKTTSPLRAVEVGVGVDISKCLHDAAIEFLESKKDTFPPETIFQIADQTRYAPGKRLESILPQE